MRQKKDHPDSTPNELSRRNFIKAGVTAGAGAVALSCVPNIFASEAGRPVAMGGKPVRTTPFPSWPVYDEQEEMALRRVLTSGKWCRNQGNKVNEFETMYQQMTGAKHCVATNSGTSALTASLAVLGAGPGDEVIVPPYTFLATVNAVLMHHALPVFVDSDPETFQIDARKIEAAITERTVAIMPVHLGGGVADLDRIMEISKRRNIPVIEDACQAVTSEWRGKKVGTYGKTGCFSFQASKNLNCGEGGCALTGDDELAYKLYCFQNNCRTRPGEKTMLTFKEQEAAPTADERRLYMFTSYHGASGANMRMSEFHAALLMAQMTRLEEQSKVREENARYLTKALNEIPGLLPAKDYEGCTRNGHYLYMFRYQAEQFAGLPRVKFIKALDAEGIPTLPGYSPLNKERYIQQAIQSRGYQRSFPADVLANWMERTRCPANDQLCEEGVWIAQEHLLGPRKDMDDILAAIHKIQANAVEMANL
jgi:dTDP-4-amino-4,6-dideoxygalactose transaminase